MSKRMSMSKLVALSAATNEYKASLCIECAMLEFRNRDEADAHRAALDHVVIHLNDLKSMSIN